MEKWTNQTAFTAAAKGMLTQMEQSKGRGENGTDCLYRGEGGKCCGVGFLMPDDLAARADSQRGGKSVLSIIEKMPDVAYLFRGIDKEILVRLQSIHDARPVETWERNLKEACERFNLKWEL